jgi:hypothetical protein
MVNVVLMDGRGCISRSQLDSHTMNRVDNYFVRERQKKPIFVFTGETLLV